MYTNKKFIKMNSIDLSYTYSLSEPVIMEMIKLYGHQLKGLMLNGKPKLAESFWVSAIPLLPNIRSALYLCSLISGVSHRKAV